MIMASPILVFIGVLLICLSAFGVAFPVVDIFKIGVAICFAASGFYYYHPRV